VPQHAEVDCSGVGLILHQVYQREWKLLSRSQPTMMLPGPPLTRYAMDPKVQQTMMGLLMFKKEDRWTMDTLTNCEWLRTVSTQNSKDGHKPMDNTGNAGRVSLQLYIPQFATHADSLGGRYYR